MNYNKVLLDRIRETTPQLVFVIKGEYIFPETINKIKHECECVINWNPDSPFNPINSTNYLLDSIPLYDVHFTWSEFLIPEFVKHSAKRVEYLPFAYDPFLHFPVDLKKDEIKHYGSDLVFVGTWDEEREVILEQLVEFDLKIWGNNWENLSSKSKLKKHWFSKAVYGKEVAKIGNASKISLNFLRNQNIHSHNMRTFEIPAIRGFMLASFSREHSKLFKIGKEIECFANINDLKAKIKYYLGHKLQRHKIALSGYEAVINGGHSYANRMETVLNIFKEF